MSQENIDAAIGQVNLMTDQDLNTFVDFIRDEMKDRQRRRNRVAKANIQVGDKVRIAGKMKPAYLTGLTGVITEKLQTRVVLKLDQGKVGKFSGSIRINPSALEKIG